MALDQSVELDIEEALRGIDTIEQALGSSATSFKVALAEALDLLNTVAVGEVDATNVTTSIDAAVEAADTSPEIDADAEGVTSAIDDAVEAADSSTVVDADAASVTSSIDDAVDAADTGVTPEATGADAITDAIEAAVADADATVEVEADTSGAEDQIASLGEAASGATESVGGLSVGTAQLGVAAQASQGKLAGLEGGLAATHPAAAGAAVGIAAVAGAATGLFHAALESDTAQRRFNQALGDMATRVNNIHVEGFATDLESLAENAGSSDEAMKLAAARIGELGRSAGASGPQIATTAENILLLSTRATVLNPTLGDAGDVADRMTNAFARGGRALAPFGIALSATEINARALADTGKDSADQLTIFEKSAAGAALAAERLGSHLKSDIVEGAKGTEIQLRSLKEAFGNTLEALGQPLLEPIIEAARAGQPILLDLARVFADLAETTLPLFIHALEAGAPAIAGVAGVMDILLTVVSPIISLLDAIPAPVLTAVGAFVGLRAIIGPLAAGFQNLFISGLVNAPAFFASLVSPVGLATVALGAITAVLVSHSEEQKRIRTAIRETSDAFVDQAKSIETDITALARQRVEAKSQIDDLVRVGLSAKQFGDLAAQGREGYRRFLDQLVRTGEITDKTRDGIIAAGFSLDGFIDNTDRLDKSNIGLVDSFEQVANVVQKGAQAALDKLVVDDKLTAAQERQAISSTKNADGTNNYVAALQSVRGTSTDAASAADEFSGALDDQAAAAEANTQAISDMIDAAISFLDSQVGAEKASLRFKDSLDKLTDASAKQTAAIREHGAASKEGQDATDKYNNALVDAKDSALNMAAAALRVANDQAEANGETLTADERLSIYRGSLQKTADSLAPNSPLRAALQGYIDTLGSVPNTVETTVVINTSVAEQRLRTIQSMIDRLNRSTGGDIVIPGGFRMAGGPVGPGSWIVGDPGPNQELLTLNPGSSGRVFSTHSPQTQEALARRGAPDTVPGGTTVNIEQLNVNEVAQDARATARVVSREIADALP